MNTLLPRGRERYHPDLKGNVTSFSYRFLLKELFFRASKTSVEKANRHRNIWFQDLALRSLENRSPKPDVLVAYSYAALAPIKWAKKNKIKIVLNQLDPGAEEEAWLRKNNRAESSKQQSAKFWEEWLQELDYADKIVVNSSWSAECLSKIGVPDHKIRIIQLCYEGVEVTSEKIVPVEFDHIRPLQILFLGQFIARKGSREILNLARLIDNKNLPIKINIAGLVPLEAAEQARTSRCCNIIGYVGPESKLDLLKTSDLLLLPSWSEGFGMTQLEAQAARLPVMYTKYCAPVAPAGISGILINNLSAESLLHELCRLIQYPRELERLSRNSTIRPEYRLDAVGARWRELFDSL